MRGRVAGCAAVAARESRSIQCSPEPGFPVHLQAEVRAGLGHAGCGCIAPGEVWAPPVLKVGDRVVTQCPDTHKQPVFWSRLGAGLITGASDDDPSGIGTYS